MPRATNLTGEYCQTCAESLDHHMKDPKDVLILDPECLKVLKASGDYELIRSGDYKKSSEERRGAASESDKGIDEQHEAEKQGLASKVKAKAKSILGE